MNTFLRIAATLSIAAFAGSARAEGSMPQMNPDSYPNQLFWLAVCFVVLYLLVSKFIAPSIGGVLEKRERAINEAIAAAETLKATAANTRGNSDSALADARVKAAELLAQAQAESTKATQDALAKLDAELASKAAAMKEDLASATLKAHAELESASESLATSMTAKLLAMPTLAKTTKKAS
jgi:F-type H+-transporting ATPase subunit b